MRTLFTSLFMLGGALSFGPQAALAQEVYTGYYFEDRTANPEDPTMGTISIVTPEDDGPFTAVMDFTFYGCQKRSSGQIDGQKTDQSLAGAWSGSTDGHPQSGSFTGAHDDGGYSGTYTVDGGKQLITVPGCIRYYVAPRGDFRMVKSDPAQPDENGEYTAEDDRARIATEGRRVGITPLDPNALYVVSISYVMPGATRNWVLQPARQEIVRGSKVYFEFDALKDEFDDTLGAFDDGWYLVTANSVNLRNMNTPAITEIFFPTR